MFISNLIAGLEQAEFDLTPREVAEIIWLWVKTAPEEESTNIEITESIGETPQVTTVNYQSSITEQKLSSSTVFELKSQSHKVDLYPKVVKQHLIEKKTSQEQKYPLQVPDAPAISNQRQLERSLKSLRRSFKSFRKQELDENKTINTIVEQTLSNPNSQIWIPIFKPIFTRRWLNLVLVIEVNNSLVIWKQTIIELRQLLKRLGIFNSLETWGLQINFSKTQPFLAWLFKLILYTPPELLTFLIISHQKEGIQLFRYDDPQMRPYPPEAINSQGKNTLILLVSDLVSPVWYRPETCTLLRLWSRKGMVNLLQLLPERLWSRTVLGQQNRLKLQATTQITQNHKLISLSSEKAAKLSEFKLSVTSLEPDRLEEWSKFLMGIGNNQCIGYGITSHQKSSLNSSSEISPQERVRGFQSIASPAALKLAELLSAVLVTLPIIRVIKYTMLSSANQSHVAEVLMGGLFQPLTETITPNSNPDEIEFQFFDGVREELLSRLTVPEITSTIEQVSTYLADNMRKSLKDFEALLMSSKNLSDLEAKTIYPFAQVSSEVLLKLGGSYANLAQQIIGIQGSSILQQFAGEYICAFKSGGETGTWYEGLENLLIPVYLLIYPQGEVKFGSQLGFVVIQNLTVKGQTLSWGLDNNETAASITFKINSEDSYFWEQYQLGKLFEGWLDYPNKDRINFRGRFNELPQLQELKFKIARIILIDDSINIETFKFEIAIIKANQSSEFNSNVDQVVKQKEKHSNDIEQPHLTIERYPAQAKGFIQDLGKDTRLEMMLIPGRTFIMGSSPEELGHQGDESPQHKVTVQPFFMGKYPVTQAQWRFVARLPQVKLKLRPNPSSFKGDNFPVENVSWNEAVEFCDRLSKFSKRKYRLPSEAEWEYACRAGTTTEFHFGETITTDLANYIGTDNEEYKWSGSYGDRPKGIYREKTTEVGSFGVANNFGLYDMHGNVWEWCQDIYHDSYKDAPIDGSAWMSNNENKYRVLRGGSWYFTPVNCRSAVRNRVSPDSRGNVIGFRVVLSGVARTLP